MSFAALADSSVGAPNHADRSRRDRAGLRIGRADEGARRSGLARPRARAQPRFRIRSRHIDRPTIRAHPRARRGRPAWWFCTAGRWVALGDCSWAWIPQPRVGQLSTSTPRQRVLRDSLVEGGNATKPFWLQNGAIFSFNKRGNWLPRATLGRVRARTRNRPWRGRGCRKCRGDTPD
jgi:hypothetical protein